MLERLGAGGELLWYLRQWAQVYSPIDDLEMGKSYVFAKDGKPGPVCTKLYERLRAIQYGDAPDSYGWVTVLDI